MRGREFLEHLTLDHPIKILTQSSYRFKDYIINLIDFLNSKKVEGLDSKLIEIKKDKENWESYLCELEFCKRIVGLSPVLIPSKRKGKKPDIKISIDGKDIFFEVKLIKDTDLSSRLFKMINEIRSDYVVMVRYDPFRLSESHIQELYKLILDNIKKYKTGKFNIADILEVNIIKKEELVKDFKKDQKTWVVLSMKKAVFVDLKKLRNKISLDFHEKLDQFRDKNIFWVLDIKRWQYNFSNLQTIFYGTTIADIEVKTKEFKDILEIFMKNPELLEGTDLLPRFIYPQKDGLFFHEEFKLLNGVIIIKGDKSKLLINPFAKNQLDIKVIRRLKYLINTD